MFLNVRSRFALVYFKHVSFYWIESKAASVKADFLWKIRKQSEHLVLIIFSLALTPSLSLFLPFSLSFLFLRLFPWTTFYFSFLVSVGGKIFFPTEVGRAMNESIAIRLEEYGGRNKVLFVFNSWGPWFTSSLTSGSVRDHFQPHVTVLLDCSSAWFWFSINSADMWCWTDATALSLFSTGRVLRVSSTVSHLSGLADGH